MAQGVDQAQQGFAGVGKLKVVDVFEHIGAAVGRIASAVVGEGDGLQAGVKGHAVIAEVAAEHRLVPTVAAIDGVIALLALEGIVASTPTQGVVAKVTPQKVVLAVTSQGIAIF